MQSRVGKMENQTYEPNLRGDEQAHAGKPQASQDAPLEIRHTFVGAGRRRVIVRKRRKMIPRGGQKTPMRARTLSQ